MYLKPEGKGYQQGILTQRLNDEANCNSVYGKCITNILNHEILS